MNLAMAVVVNQPQSREVVLAPAFLGNHMMNVEFLAIFQVLVTDRTETLLSLDELPAVKDGHLGLGSSLLPIMGILHIPPKRYISEIRCHRECSSSPATLMPKPYILFRHRNRLPRQRQQWYELGGQRESTAHTPDSWSQNASCLKETPSF